ncbi:MAG: aminotransferase class I/II-fold pyridoxal phosphate-dependent enzyme [Spirochaetales bacterium]|nr:aminotransferase class I/II-fold pyridoxal phosphate-dependent enzyme [Spirochaetales bacterium]
MNIYLREISEMKGSKVKIAGKELISYTDCSYLGLNDHPKIKEAMISALNKYGTNNSSSRLLGGTTELHSELERRLARFTGNQASIVYSLGYMANLGCISALVHPEEFILLDMKSHASLVDASMLSHGKIIPFRHNRLDALEKTLERVKGKALIVTEGVFSMEGNIPPLDELYELANKYEAGLMVDDAHGLFIIGENGRGTAELFNLEGKIDISMGTLSKTIPLIGGFIAGNETIIKHLIASSRTFIFTLALPPHIVAGAMAALDVIEEKPELRTELFKRVDYVSGKLQSLGFKKHNSVSPIIPVDIGNEEHAYKIMKILEKRGIFVDVAVYPAGKIDKAILRFIITLKHSYEELDYTITELGKACKQFGII